MELLTDFLLSAVSSPWVYLVVFAIVVIDGFFPPVPSESIVVVAAALGVSAGSPNPIVIVVLAAIGAALGDNIAYWIGSRIGVSRFRWMRGPRAASAIDRAGRGLVVRPASLLLTARYIPVGRTAVNMTAGATEFPHRRFWPLTMLAGACWAVYSVLIGTIAGAWVKDQPLLGAAIGVVLALTLGLVIDRIASAAARRQRWSAPLSLRGRGLE
ncbi:membrane protein DedA with SNARE-associated domain [Glaciihabitans tibetensis]|uniref:Membrane protein DedA with SNARE-associated domain n=1 Tax=Glaciihabitans tibetensis TaxID=1266600 RepID=A0A2T0VAA9_9MICO|nr:DedA family protein [Glaciihabitans tibetensis]PRY67136.1 membrane protein DedA with SNARE-associated domain [Glaciihabitans tibetensis]